MLRTLILFLSFLVCLSADDPQAGTPQLGWGFDFTSQELLRYVGVPGSVAVERTRQEPADRFWFSPSYLLSLRDSQLQIRDLSNSTVAYQTLAAGNEIIFSSNGRRFTVVPANEPPPLLLNDGTLLPPTQLLSDAAAFAEDLDQLAAASSSELVLFAKVEDTWQASRRLPLSYSAGVRQLHLSGNALYILTKDGDLHRLDLNSLEDQLVSTSVRSFMPLARDGFFRFENSSGPRLFYPQSPGQKQYELPGAKLAVSNSVEEKR